MQKSILAEEENPCYCERFSNLFLNSYIPFEPLWTGLVFRHSPSDKIETKRFSNPVNENWFYLIKGSVKERQTALKYEDF